MILEKEICGQKGVLINEYNLGKDQVTISFYQNFKFNQELEEGGLSAEIMAWQSNGNSISIQ